MTFEDAKGWALIIGTTVSALTALVAAIRVKRVAAQAESIEGKVDTVHDLTNSRLARIEGELAATRAALVIARDASVVAEATRATLAQEAARAQDAPRAPRAGTP